MRHPVDNFKENWNTTAGYGFGDPTSYGFHEADDLNNNAGGNADLGQPLYAITNGQISSVHLHNTSPTFGKHLHLKFEIDGKTYWAHYAHCNEIFVKEGDNVTEGQKIATVGNSGTVYAHCHFAIKNQPTGVDGIAKTKADLTKWESPIKFIEERITDSHADDLTKMLNWDHVVDEGNKQNFFDPKLGGLDKKGGIIVIAELNELRRSATEKEAKLEATRAERDKALAEKCPNPPDHNFTEPDNGSVGTGGNGGTPDSNSSPDSPVSGIPPSSGQTNPHKNILSIFINFIKSFFKEVMK